jgi:leader peptidase (prepilin peptidase)/N-methyltransferase
LPVLGWLLLRGRCYDCGSPIAMRYPLVEGLTAVMFALIGGMEFVGRRGEMGDTAWMWGAFYQLCLLSTLLGAALMAWDKARTPDALFGPALLVGLAVPCWMPEVGYFATSRWSGTANWIAHGLETRVIDSAALLLVGFAVSRGFADERLRRPLNFSLALAGLYWGIAAIAVAIGVGLLLAVGPVVWERWAGWVVFVGAFLIALAINMTDQHALPASGWTSHAAGMLAGLLLAWLLGGLARRRKGVASGNWFSAGSH